MIRFALLTLALSGFLATGCTTCRYRAAYDALALDESSLANGSQRSKVVAVLVGPEATLDPAGLGTMAKRLNDAGFARVYHGGIVLGDWLNGEIKRIHSDDPDTKFVLVGYDLGARMAREMACQLSLDGIPVNSLVLLDPRGVESVGNLPDYCHVTIIRSHGWMKGTFPGSLDTTVPGVGHFDLPTHVETVATVAGVLESTASQIPTLNPLYVPNRPARLGSDWDFLLGPSPAQDHANPSAPLTPKIAPERTAKLDSK
ncbi:MAG: hypothetical protein U0798_21515 [Gemmataceae bacterium]